MGRYVVIGASRGIGAALVASLAADGHTVFAGARSVGVMRHEFRDLPMASAQFCDVTNSESVQHCWEQIGWAGGNLDGLVVTVGAQGEINRFPDADLPAWEQTVALNLCGPARTVYYGLPHLKPDARIILCAGGGSHRPWPHYSAYACAKAGVVRLVETLAQELSQPVNALAPGFCPTLMHEATLQAGPERAAEAWGRAAEARRLRAIAAPLGQPLPPVERAVACARWLLHDAPPALRGRTISAQHDPWQRDPGALLAPDVGTTQRVPAHETAYAPRGGRVTV